MSRRVLIGTTNPSKILWLQDYLHCIPGIECVTLRQLGVTVDPPEDGRTPEENAIIKALAYHKATGLAVISHDSGLYFREFSMEDPRQPGLHIRRVGSIILDDDGMMNHYSRLAREYGPLHACYLSGFAAVDEAGNAKTFAQDRLEDEAYFSTFGFLMVAEPHAKRHPGWPLDSLSKDLHTGEYWFDQEERTDSITDSDYSRNYRKNVSRFFAEFFSTH